MSPKRLVVLITAGLWITFACVMPLQNAREARRQAHLQLVHTLAQGQLSVTYVTAAFDRSTQDVIAASTMPCLLMAVCVVFLVHQMLKLKRRYLALERDLRSSRRHAYRLGEEAAE